MNIVVFGGTGFLGRHVCISALNAGMSVTSLSQSGKLTDFTGIEQHTSAVGQIRWQQANIFDPSSYSDTIRQADAVVHSMGTIFDTTEYKKLVNSSPSVTNLVKLAKLRFQGQNPMQKQGSLFDKLNRDSAIVLANEVKQGKDKSLVYVSAADWNPLADPNYIRSKREAEQALSKMPELRSVFIRPGFMYDANDASLRGSLGTAASTISSIGAHVGLDCVQSKNPSLPVQTVAKAIVESIQDDTITGVVELSALQKYASFG